MTSDASWHRLAWLAFIVGSLGLVTAMFLWASYIRLVSHIQAWGWLEAQPLTWSGTISPMLALIGLLLSGLALLVLRAEGRRPGQELARMGLVTSLLGLSVVYPWFICARDSARRSVCAVNMSRTAKVMSVYASQNSGKYPPDLQSVLRIWPGFNTSMTCPSMRTYEAENWYGYMPGSWQTGDPKDVLLYEKRWNHLSDGANVMFANLHVEWVQPYSRVLELVEQTKQRHTVKAVQTGAALAAPAATQPAP